MDLDKDLDKLQRDYDGALRDVEKYRSYAYVQKYFSCVKRAEALKAAIDGNERKRKREWKEGKEGITCYYCQRKGHYARNCFRRRAWVLKETAEAEEKRVVSEVEKKKEEVGSGWKERVVSEGEKKEEVGSGWLKQLKRISWT